MKYNLIAAAAFLAVFVLPAQAADRGRVGQREGAGGA